jgi:hypothetical protein
VGIARRCRCAKAHGRRRADSSRTVGPARVLELSRTCSANSVSLPLRHPRPRVSTCSPTHLRDERGRIVTGNQGPDPAQSTGPLSSAVAGGVPHSRPRTAAERGSCPQASGVLGTSRPAANYRPPGPAGDPCGMCYAHGNAPHGAAATARYQTYLPRGTVSA